MKIALHHTPGSFSDYWIQYLEENNIPYKIVNCYNSDIIQQLEGCNALMWHWDHNCYKAALFARQLTISIELMGIKVFPNTNTSWHHDDKLGQKYLLESIQAPFIKSYIFYDKFTAIEWAKNTTYPKVFKLRGGAGSLNVKRISSKDEALRKINKAFSNGYAQIDKLSRLKESVWQLRRDGTFKSVKGIISGLMRLFIPTDLEKYSSRHKGYVYFQDFIDGNDYDIRLVVVGDKCYGITRYCRKGDFRASGSGIKSYDNKIIPTECVKIAFDVSKNLNLQSVAFDFIKDKNQYKVIEISYCFVSNSFPGYWDKSMFWHEEISCPQTDMIRNFINNEF